MIDLTTSYMGFRLKNPIVCSPSPLCESVDNIRRMEEAGASAVVLHSLFEEQITLESNALDRHLSHGAESFAEALSYFPVFSNYRLSPDAHIDYLHKVKEAVQIPVIASLNGVSSGGWIAYAKKMEQAGADALELNVYFIPADPEMTGADVEQMYVDLVKDLRSSVAIPLAVKIGPYFSALAHMAGRIVDAGADALVLFNRFYQPDLDIENLEVVPSLTLSSSESLLLRLRWIAILYGRTRADLALTGGVHTAEDVLKAMMAGAKIAMTTSGLLRLGINHVRTLLSNTARWMEEHEYSSIEQMQGSMSQRAVAEPSAFERANYLRTLGSYTGKPTAS